MNRSRRGLLIGGMILAVLFLDRVTKLLALETLSGRAAEEYLGGFLRLAFHENRGAMLSLGAELPESIRFLFFTVLVGLVLMALLVFVLAKRNLTMKDALAAALVIGGGLGNVLDRLFYDGAVLDFLNIGVDGLRTGVFNVADMAIIAGTAVFLLAPRGSTPANQGKVPEAERGDEAGPA